MAFNLYALYVRSHHSKNDVCTITTWANGVQQLGLSKHFASPADHSVHLRILHLKMLEARGQSSLKMAHSIDNNFIGSHYYLHRICYQWNRYSCSQL